MAFNHRIHENIGGGNMLLTPITAAGSNIVPNTASGES